MQMQRAITLTVLLSVALLGVRCARAPVDWQWVGGPPGPLALNAAAPFVAHGGSVVVTANGGVGHYAFTFDDGGAGGTISVASKGNSVTYFAPSSGDAASVTITAKSGAEIADTSVSVPASGALDTRCGDVHQGYRHYEFTGSTREQAFSMTLASDVIDMFGSSTTPAIPNNAYAVRGISALDLAPIGNRWGQPSGDFRIDPGRGLDIGNGILGVAAGPSGSVFYAGPRTGTGMIVGRLNADGTQNANFGGAGQRTRLFSDPRYLPDGIAYNAVTDRVAVAVPFQPSTDQDSIRLELLLADGTTGSTSTQQYPVTAETAETNSPFVLPLADGKYLVPSGAYPSGTIGVARFTSGPAVDSSWNGTGRRTMDTSVALTAPWAPQAVHLTDDEVYVAGAKGSTVWINSMSLSDGSVRRASLSFGSGTNVVTAVLPQKDGGAIVVGYGPVGAVTQAFLVRFAKSPSGGLQADADAFGGFPQTTDALNGAAGTENYAFEAAELDAQGRILAVGWRELSGKKVALAACLFP